ncbi:MAG TPA: NADP-dependent oxidoreductase [Dactylosporangium sp.]|nr:NADP-dependent oxidoreductase [Dactylosporangium sp.]
MFAVVFDRFGGPEVLRVGEVAQPQPGAGEVRIRVRAAGLSPVDGALRAGRSPAAARLELPHIPGVDAAGVVDAIGDGVAGVGVGDEVFGAVDVARLGGATAELAVLRFWAPRGSLPWAEAGAAGTSVETATRTLDRLGVAAGSTLLIDGAAGGVGSVAVQLAVARGARVIGTARRDNLDFLAALGAEPVEYGPALAGRINGSVDLALDVAGRGGLGELQEIAGSVLTIADFNGPELGVPMSVGALGGEPDGRHGLAVAAGLHAQGRFRVPIQQVYPMTRAPQAHAALERPGRRGKLVIEVSAPGSE